MDSWALDVKGTLVRIRTKGLDLTANNDDILHWYNTIGCKKEHKRKYRKLTSAVAYLMRNNDLKTLEANERTLLSMREISKLRSDDMLKMRLQIDGFAYEKQSWLRQTEAFNKTISDLERKLSHGQKDITQLEECCGSAGFPVAAIRQTLAGVTTSGRQSESDDDVLCAIANRTPFPVLAHGGSDGARVKRRHHYSEDEDSSPPRDNSDSDSDFNPGPAPRFRERSPIGTRFTRAALPVAAAQWLTEGGVAPQPTNVTDNQKKWCKFCDRVGHATDDCRNLNKWRQREACNDGKEFRKSTKPGQLKNAYQSVQSQLDQMQQQLNALGDCQSSGIQADIANLLAKYGPNSQ